MNLNNTHFKYFSILIILIFLLYFIINSIPCKESFVIKNDIMNVKDINKPLGKGFDIDQMCINKDKKYIGWKCFTKDNYSFSSVKNDNSFKGTAYETYSKNNPLLYDGVFKLD